jgi:hypothetical protein
MAIQTASSLGATKQRAGTIIALAVGGGLVAVVMAAGIATWRDAAQEPAVTTGGTTGARFMPRTAPVEQYPEDHRALSEREAAVEPTLGGLAELYREQVAATGAASSPREDTRGGLAELYDAQAPAESTGR